MEELVRIHTIAYNLQDVKVLFNHDLKIELSNVHINGSRGEILAVPRWIADIIRLADSSRLTNEIAQKLTIEEREFYNQIHINSINFKKQIFGNL